jgi:glyoxylase-like metal-dependent hydrolase (beta-lactamase superfamily II)
MSRGARAGRRIRRRATERSVRLIDLQHLGRARVIGSYLVDEVIVDPGPASCLPTLLSALGDTQPRALLLTHIHLDHAGASGSLVERWPELEVYVHERGAPHLADPGRLLESARRLYGEDMDRLWGEMLPVPEANLRTLSGGERLFDDSFTVAYTPGHASHHVSYLHEGTAFVGDVGGVRITSSSLTIPPTPPPDIDVEAWHASIERVAAWRPRRLAMTHFGFGEDVDDQLDEVASRLDAWAELARDSDEASFISAVETEIEADAGADVAAAYLQAAPPQQLYAGLSRYWRKRADSASVS